MYLVILNVFILHGEPQKAWDLIQNHHHQNCTNQNYFVSMYWEHRWGSIPDFGIETISKMIRDTLTMKLGLISFNSFETGVMSEKRFSSESTD